MTRLSAIVAACLVVSGCLEVEQAVRVRQDFSGDLTTAAVIDLEEARHFDLWNGGMREDEPSPEEYLSSLHETCRKLAEETPALKAALPPGTSLADSTCRAEGAKVLLRRRFTFDHVSKLPSLLAIGGNGFQGIRLHVRDDGASWVLSAAGEDLGPLNDLQELMPQDESEVAQAKAFRVRGSFTLAAASEVGENNAHRKDGKTLVWEYDSLRPPAKEPEILVRLSKKAKS